MVCKVYCIPLSLALTSSCISCVPETDCSLSVPFFFLQHCPLSLFPAVSAARDAAGNIDVKRLQQVQQMASSLTEETSKKDD